MTAVANQHNLINSIEQELHLVLNQIDNATNNSLLTTVNKFILSKVLKPKLFRSKLLLTLIDNITHNNSNIIFSDEQILNKNNKTQYCVIIELLNIASNIHNAIYFNSYNQPQPNNLTEYKFYGHKITLEQAVLLGDLLFTIAFEKMVSLKNIKILEQFSAATKDMALYEAKLSEVTEQDCSINNILDLTTKKFWPLYGCILFFIENIIKDKTVISESKSLLADFNKLNILNKIKNHKIIYNKHISDFLYDNIDLNSRKLNDYFNNDISDALSVLKSNKLKLSINSLNSLIKLINS